MAAPRDASRARRHMKMIATENTEVTEYSLLTLLTLLTSLTYFHGSPS
jgi:hypothetical protein